MSSRKANTLKQFCQICQVTKTVGTKILKEQNWSLEAGLNYYFTHAPAIQQPPKLNDGSIAQMFKKYQDENNPKEMSEVGMDQFFLDLGIQPDGLESLVIGYIFECPEPGPYELQCYTTTCHRLSSDNFGALQSAVRVRLDEILASKEYKKFYRWLFVHVQQENQRTIDKDLSIQLWELVFAKENFELYAPFAEWLNTKEDITRINKDIWNLLFDFFKETKSDFSEYDFKGGSAWPSTFDEFAVHMKNKETN